APPAERSRPTSPGTELIALLLTRTPGLSHFLSELAEQTEPPFFKSFLRLDVDGDRLTITCYGVTGFAGDASRPTIEDRVEISLKTPPGGSRRASVGRAAGNPLA
ncbi:MAG: hypothetical protein ACR2OC_07765, partial [Solirubrobacterales bacterium]